MTSLASSASSGCTPGDNDAAWDSRVSSTLDALAVDKRDSPTPPTRDLWFYSHAQQQLAPVSESPSTQHTGAPSPAMYGLAARALRQRTRPVSADVVSLVRFDVMPSTALTATMGFIQKEANGRAARLRQRSRIPLNPTHNTVHSSKTSVHVADGAPASQDGVGRLVSVLNQCDQTQPQRPLSPGRKSLHHSYNTSQSIGSLHTPHPPGGRTQRSGTKTLLSSHVVDLTQRWVSAEQEEAASAAAQSADSSNSRAAAAAVKMPPHRVMSTRTAPLACDSCVMRLRKGKFESMPTARAESPLGSPPVRMAVGRPSSASALKERLVAEPVRSYRILKDATTPLAALHPTSHIPLLEAARLRRANLERLTHNFEHQRYVLHGELEDALEWRGQCQAAVLRRSSSEHVAATGDEAPQQNAEEIYQGLLDEVFARRSYRRPKTAYAAPMRTSAVGFRSAWTAEAMRRAVYQEKTRLTRLLNAFEPNCGAAALTLAAVEDFRAETIKRVWNPEVYASSHGSALYGREHFLKYLLMRFPMTLPTLSLSSALHQPNDILDALPSKAESSFAKFAYEILPSCGADA